MGSSFSIAQLTPLRGLILAGLLLSGCSDGGESGSEGAGMATVRGTVRGGGPVAGAYVVFVESSDAVGEGSVQPLEDAADEAKVRVQTGRGGEFSAKVPVGRYFVFVEPAEDDTRHLPGGSLSTESVQLSGGSVTIAGIFLSERPGPDAADVGSSACLQCHGSHATCSGTLHFAGIRRLTPAGPEPSELQDLSAFDDADRGLAFYEDGNEHDNTEAADDGYGYRLGTESGYNVLLGKDEQGYFQALESPEGSVSARLPVVFTYGGEGVLQQDYVTRLGADGRVVDDPASVAYYILPARFSELKDDSPWSNGTQPVSWVSYRPEDWGPPAADGEPPAATPAADRSFDQQCAGCHYTGMALTRGAGDGLYRARAVSDPGGVLDLDGGGRPDEMNVGCERCHGPGSEHVARAGGAIVQPQYLAPGRADMICGQCHALGHGDGVLEGPGSGPDGGGDAPGAYPSRNDPGGGGVEFVRAGASPAEFFGQDDGRGILPDFGTSGGFFSPVDLGAGGEATYGDARGGFGSRHDHARADRLHYMDHVRSPHFQNERQILTCSSCHDPHARTSRAQLREPAENNQLCLRCHAGEGDFEHLTDEDVDRIGDEGFVPHEVAATVKEHVLYRTFDVVGVAMNLGVAAYMNPAGDSELGRCVTCHMPRTASAAGWIVDEDGFTIRGDISSHTFDNISPLVPERMAGAGVEPVPNSCVPCHRGLPAGAYPDYRYKK